MTSTTKRMVICFSGVWHMGSSDSSCSPDRILSSLSSLHVDAFFVCRRPSRRYDPNHPVRFYEGMHHQKEAEVRTEADHDVPIFVTRVALVAELDGALIEKDRLRFFDRIAMYPLVAAVLSTMTWVRTTTTCGYLFFCLWNSTPMRQSMKTAHRDVAASRERIQRSEKKYQLNSAGDFAYPEHYPKIENTTVGTRSAARRIVDHFGFELLGNAGSRTCDS